MSATYEIPLQPYAQMLKISLAGVYYNLTVLWNGSSNNWNVDIADNEGNPIIAGIPMLVGADLLSQHKHLNLGGELIAYVEVDAKTVALENPTYANLGLTGHLRFVVL